LTERKLEEPTGLGLALCKRLSLVMGGDIWLAQDEPICREILTDLLEAAGLRVDSAGNGATAMEIARQTDDALNVIRGWPGHVDLETTNRMRRPHEGQCPGPVRAHGGKPEALP
jgi:CheY-like chemotaxis protein